jgi:hypothetical protein
MHTIYINIPHSSSHIDTLCIPIFLYTRSNMHTHHVCQYLCNQVTVRTFTTHLSCQYLGGVVCDITVQDTNRYDSIKCSRADNHVKVWKMSSIPETDLSPELHGANDGLVEPVLVSRCSNVHCVCLHWARAQDGLGALWVSRRNQGRCTWPALSVIV